MGRTRAWWAYCQVSFCRCKYRRALVICISLPSNNISIKIRKVICYICERLIRVICDWNANQWEVRRTMREQWDERKNQHVIKLNLFIYSLLSPRCYMGTKDTDTKISYCLTGEKIITCSVICTIVVSVCAKFYGTTEEESSELSKAEQCRWTVLQSWNSLTCWKFLRARWKIRQILERSTLER